MIQAEHSPGPWNQKADHWTRIYSSETEIARILPIHPIGQRQKSDFTIETANARLMAAAPKLLKACQQFMGCITSDGQSKCSPNDEDFALGRKAIAKAMNQKP